jgi:4,4'-diaponeurosporenoate glycosyltransferase
MAGILVILCFAFWLIGFALAMRMRKCSGGEASSTRSISIIIPARNEESNLPRLLRSIASQEIVPMETIVVDDDSTDSTANIARQLGAIIVASKPLPEGWRGKTWACQQGAERAGGELLLFLDADTWLETGGMSRVLSEYRSGALSISPYHSVCDLYEGLSIFFNIIMNMATAPHGLFGQSLLIDRQTYFALGGHESVKGTILENLWLADCLAARGLPVQSVVGRGVLSCRMYPAGIGELIAGWTKAFASGAGHTPPATMLMIVIWIIGLVMPLNGLWSAELRMAWGAMYAACALQMLWIARKVGRFPIAFSIFYPVPLLFFFAVFARSALRSGKPIQWKGRDIRAD